MCPQGFDALMLFQICIWRPLLSLYLTGDLDPFRSPRVRRWLAHFVVSPFVLSFVYASCSEASCRGELLIVSAIFLTVGEASVSDYLFRNLFVAPIRIAHGMFLHASLLAGARLS